MKLHNPNFLIQNSVERDTAFCLYDKNHVKYYESGYSIKTKSKQIDFF